ncbi:PepSY domain-containing protein [Lachnospiraceae bacterium 62-35]
MKRNVRMYQYYWFKAAAVGMIALAVFTGCKKADTADDYISIDAAKEEALKAASLSENQVEFSSASLDLSQDTSYYQVIFIENGTEHTYNIDALTGNVIGEYHKPSDSSKETPLPEGKNPTTPSDGNGEGQTQQTPVPESPKTVEGQEKADAALATALSHAGLEESNIRFREIKQDIENGKAVYEVELIAENGAEYDYEIDAEDGSILSFDYDGKGAFQRRAAADQREMISEEQAKQMILEHIPGARTEDIVMVLREDDGRKEYKGRLMHDNMEYEFEIDASSGFLIEWEGERRP